MKLVESLKDNKNCFSKTKSSSSEIKIMDKKE